MDHIETKYFILYNKEFIAQIKIEHYGEFTQNRFHFKAIQMVLSH